MDSKEALFRLERLKSEIDSLLFYTKGGKYQEVDSCIKYQDTPDDRMLGNEFHWILDKLQDVSGEIEYLTKPIKETGTLLKKNNGRYAMFNSRSDEVMEFSCGTGIEALIYDEVDEKYTWVISRIEHDGMDYYIVGNHDAKLSGIKVRIR